jgi:hypothetical protein
VLAGNVAGPNDHREAKPKLSLLVADDLLVLDVHHHSLGGAAVGDRDREDVRALLLEEGRLLARLLRLLVRLARLLALPDLAFDHPLPDLEAHGVDGGALGEREDVDALEPPGGRIQELLGDRHPRDRTGDSDPDVGPDGGHLVRPAGDVGVDEQAAVGDARWSLLGQGARGPDGCQDRHQPADQSESHDAPP